MYNMCTANVEITHMNVYINVCCYHLILPNEGERIGIMYGIL